MTDLEAFNIALLYDEGGYAETSRRATRTAPGTPVGLWGQPCLFIIICSRSLEIRRAPMPRCAAPCWDQNSPTTRFANSSIQKVFRTISSPTKPNYSIGQ